MIRSEQAGWLSGEGSSGIAGRRVLMTADAVGGIWTYALDLARGLGEREIKTTLVVLGPAPSPDQRGEAGTVPGLDLVEIDLPLDWTAESRAEILRAGEAIADLARDVAADLIHLNSPAFAARARFDVPVVGICHSCMATWWIAMRGTPLPPDFAWRTDLVARGYAACDALIAPTAAFARATAEAYGISTPIVVHNGRPPLSEGAAPTLSRVGEGRMPRIRGEGSPSPAKLKKVMEVFRLGDGGQPLTPSLSHSGEGAGRVLHSGFVFTAGRLWDEGKNIALLDRAAARLAVPVLAAGPTESPNGARIALSHIQPLGRLSPAEVAQHLAAQPIFVSTARYEPFGLAVLEAAQAGCPLVLSDIPSFRELWEGVALFVPPEDDPALAAALDRLIANPALHDSLGRKASERARDYTVDRMVDGIVEVYRGALAQPVRPARVLSETLAL